MAGVRSHRIGTGAAVFGHSLALLGFVQPWVIGQFGARQRLTGLDLTRLAGDAFSQGVAGEMLTMPLARLALLVVPLAAANALALLLTIRFGLIAPTTAHRTAAWLGAPIAVVAGAGIVLVILSEGDGAVLSGPGFGLPLVTAGAFFALGSLWLSDPRRDVG